jgi:hypothetical protein
MRNSKTFFTLILCSFSLFIPQELKANEQNQRKGLFGGNALFGRRNRQQQPQQRQQQVPPGYYQQPTQPPAHSTDNIFPQSSAPSSAEAPQRSTLASSVTSATNSTAYAQSYLERVRAEGKKRGTEGRYGYGLFNGPEKILQNNSKLSEYADHFNSGEELLYRLSKFTEAKGCIPKLTIASHGWGTTSQDGGQGIPIIKNFSGSGLYLNKEDQMQSIRKQAEKDNDTSQEHIARLTEAAHDGRNLNDLLTAIRSNQIRFCDACLIQLHSCNISDSFAEHFAQISNCQLVYGTGDTNAEENRIDDGSKDHIWISNKKAGNSRDGNFYRLTPAVNSSGQRVLYKEAVGFKERITIYERDDKGRVTGTKSAEVYKYVSE